ncbi:adenylosuccinate synthase [Salibacter halophilus]|uniref:Adenylosuccinate synthetase n=1 Tax=Salibacter halophilus TaxID=1803916 RepID=A0A6N6MAV7_9FLAO|nr:adenylosuccinate synthase [Salibacter halophilus]KAB1066129.1 adenylosuccinate synthase [Salibacter halophilus]
MTKADVLLGLQWGDEGKGKIVDVLTPEYDIIARFQGGPNAGHTLEFNEIKHVLHTIPSGIFRPDTQNIIGNGVVIDPVTLAIEIDSLKELNVDVQESIQVSKKAHLILPTHRLLDAASERAKGKEKIGSTLKGIGPTYMDKTGRNGLRVGDIIEENFKERYENLKSKHLELLKNYDYPLDELADMESVFFESVNSIRELTLIDSEHTVNRAMTENKKVLAEGAQGSLLDIDFGSYPFVTSSNTICAGACTGLGIAPNKIGEVYGIFKAYCTRVGSGPFPTELFDEDGKRLATKGHEFGATTGRPRRCGWLDIPALKYAIMLNGVTQLIMTKADVLSAFDEIKVCTHYKYKGETIDYFPYDVLNNEVEPIWKSMKAWQKDLTNVTSIDELPQELMDYVTYLEQELQVPIKIISVGPRRSQTLLRD